MWATVRGLRWEVVKGVGLIAGLVCALAGLGLFMSSKSDALGEATQQWERREYIEGTDIEVHRVHDPQWHVCFIVVEGAGAFQVSCDKLLVYGAKTVKRHE